MVAFDVLFELDFLSSLLGFLFFFYDCYELDGRYKFANQEEQGFDGRQKSRT